MSTTTPIDPAVQALCDEFEIEVVGPERYPGPMQTRAPQSINLILERYGEAHTRIVLMTIAETKTNQPCIDRIILWAVSDLVLIWQKVIDRDASKWFEAWDRMPIGDLQFLAVPAYGKAPLRGLVSGMIHERLCRCFGDAEFPNMKTLPELGREMEVAGVGTVKPLRGDEISEAMNSSKPREKLLSLSIGTSLKTFQQLPVEVRDEIELAYRALTSPTQLGFVS